MAKRAFDLVVSAVALLCLAPVLALLALAVRLDSPGPALFRQERVGRHGRLFRIHKFRTMVVDAPSRGPALTVGTDPRITRLGVWLRRSRLDELPQLLDVLRGDMSLVGPRPEEAWLVRLYSDQQRRRLAVRPGMTGPMQVNGRGDLTFAQRLQLELDYIEHYSLRRDIVILLKTIPVVLKGSGAY